MAGRRPAQAVGLRARSAQQRLRRAPAHIPVVRPGSAVRALCGRLPQLRFRRSARNGQGRRRTVRPGERRHTRVTHQRIRPFNTRDTYPEQNLDNDLCQAVVAGDTVYVRGQIGQDLDTSENVGVGDVGAQTEQAMTNIATLLAEAEATLDDIVKVTVYLVDPRYRESVYRVIGRWLKGVHP